MNKNAIAKAPSERFHGQQEIEGAYKRDRNLQMATGNYAIVQSRDVSYRFYLHQHPHVRPLTQRLLREGTAGLQAADTDYAADKTSLPGSVQVELPDGIVLALAAQSRLVLPDEVNVGPPGGPVNATLVAGMEVRLTNGLMVNLKGSASVTLLDGMSATPAAGSSLGVPANTTATTDSATPVLLPGNTALTLNDGAQVFTGLNTQTKASLRSATQFSISNATQAKIIRSKPRPTLYADVFSATHYNPDPALVQLPYPVKDLDFSSGGAYAVYNWELFFHVPMLIAIHLSKNQRFAEAQRWFHFLFDPTDDSEGPTPERFWKVRPFQTTDVKKIEEILVNLATGADEALRNETIRSIEAWKDAPFRPHVIARYRQQAYMVKTVMAYLDNLIAWGDSLFRQDTGEAIDEAMMVYVLAANILGARPQPVPKKGTVRPQTYANLQKDIAQFGVVLRDVEAALPFDLMPLPGADSGDDARLATLRSMGQALYFCVPRNDKLLGYWDTVADRLFKIRNSLNFQGTFRQLALFEPPIDPGMLARATAAGLDVGAIVNGLNQPLPLVRFQLLVRNAAEICQEVKSLGNNLLSAMEKEDGEAMAILRAKHERVVMGLVEQIKYGQVQEAIKSREGSFKAMALAVQRFVYYEKLLGKSDNDIAIPELDELDGESLHSMGFTSEEPELKLKQPNLLKAIINAQVPGIPMNAWEATELVLLTGSHISQAASGAAEILAASLGLIPEFQARATPVGVGAGVTYGGKALSTAASFGAKAASAIAADLNFMANMTSKISYYTRRAQDWEFQSNLAAGEINQVFKQMRAAQIREAVAEMELKSHRQQMKHAEEIEHFLNEEGTEMKGKKTNKALYTWMKREVKGLYAQCFQFAFDVAKKAERALQHELGNPELAYLQFGYLAGKEGLLAGERLYFDIRRMEMAYHDLNQREFELTKHVSLLQVNPLALIQLRVTGRCTVMLSEALFDMDGPGHYFRRIKTVAVSIPCVTGSYTSVNCTLTLLKSSIRKTPVLRDGAYAREDAEDDRFSDYFGSPQSIVTSSAQNDSGMFETNLRDERFLPFENSGVISEWQLELPANPGKKEPTQFDYNTISDVMLHIRYTARQGGGLLRSEAVKNVATSLEEARAAGSVRLFSVRHEFPTEWAKFLGQKQGVNQRLELALSLREEHYPFWSQGLLKSVQGLNILVRIGEVLIPPLVPIPASLDIFTQIGGPPAAEVKDSLTKDAAQGNLLIGKLSTSALPPKPVGDLKLFFDETVMTSIFENKTMGDLWIAVTWSSA